MGSISNVQKIVDAVIYLTEAPARNRGGAARGRRCAHWQMVTGEESLAVTLVRWKHRILAIAVACFPRKRSH